MITSKIDQVLTTYGNECQLIIYKTPYYVHDTKPPPRSEDPEKSELSLSRTRMHIYRSIQCNISQHGNYKPTFLTLTYAKNQKDRKEATRELRLYHMRLRYHLNIQPRYIAVPEFQERGAVHYHVVYFNLPFTSVNELEKIWSHGFIKIKALEEVKKISSYISKYVTKEAIDKRHKNHRLLITSRGLYKPQIFYNNEVDTKLQNLYTKQVAKLETKDKIIITYDSTSSS